MSVSYARFHETRRNIDRELARVTVEFRWAHNTAYERTVADEEKVSVGGTTDPTGGLVTSKQKVKLREACDRAHERMLDAASSLRQAEQELLKALEKLDPPERPDPLRFPRTASNDDLKAAKAAREKRKERGEHIP